MSDRDGESEEENEQLLDWRLDPEESYSDWTIEITSKHQQETTENAKTVYHVHKAILAFGSRRSEYFARLFRSKNFQEAESNKSCIELHEFAVEAFPSMLDYLYNPPSEPLFVTTETATALHFLGEYFGIRHLRRDVVEFVGLDIFDEDVNKCLTYYEHASIFNDEKIMKQVENWCIDDPTAIRPSDMIIKVAEPKFWLTVFQRDTQENSECYDATNEYNDRFLKSVSRLVAEICYQNEDMDAELFKALTDAKQLPVICPNAALRFLKFESRFAAEDDTELSSIQERCINALAQNWQTVGFAKSNVMRILQTQRPTLLAELLVKMAGCAKQDLKENQNDA